jgi:hypothetical protein
MTEHTPQTILDELLAKFPELQSQVVPKIEKGPGILERAFTKTAGYFRMSGWGLGAALLGVGVYFFIPQEFEVALWKSALVASAAFGGYWLDRTLFPYARPHALTADEHDFMWSKDDPQGHVFVGSMIRRALLVIGTMVAVGASL